MKVALISLTAILSLVGANAFAAQSCHPHAILSCTSQYWFASGSALPGPTSHGAFQQTPDDGGLLNCDAYASQKVPGTDIELDASIMDMGNGQMSFDLFTNQGNQMSNTAFDQTGTHKYSAYVTLNPSEAMMMNSGIMEELVAIAYDCSLIEKSPKLEQISCEMLYDLDGPSDDDMNVPAHVQKVDHSDLYGYSVNVMRNQIVATLTDKKTGRAISHATRLADFNATNPYMPRTVVSAKVGRDGIELVEVNCSPDRK